MHPSDPGLFFDGRLFVSNSISTNMFFSGFHDSILQGCTCLQIGSFTLDYQICWHVFVPNFNDPLYFCGVSCIAFASNCI